MFFLPKKIILEKLQDLKKNGVDVLMLAFKSGYDGKVRDTNPGRLGKNVKMKYQTVANGLNYLVRAGILRWQGDDVICENYEKIFKPGQGGYFVAHDIFADKEFIKVNEVPKKLALRLLSTGIGSQHHRLSKKGLTFKAGNLMRWAGVDRLSRLEEALKSLKKYFIITYCPEKNKFNIAVRPKYLVSSSAINKFKASYAGLYGLLREKKIFISDPVIKKDILNLIHRYGYKLVGHALEQARYNWKNVSNPGGYLHTIILGCA
jgi:hypothetical protein